MWFALGKKLVSMNVEVKILISLLENQMKLWKILTSSPKCVFLHTGYFWSFIKLQEEF